LQLTWIIVGYALLCRAQRTGSVLLPIMTGFVFLAATVTAAGLVRNSVIGLSVLRLFPALLIAAWFWRPLSDSYGAAKLLRHYDAAIVSVLQMTFSPSRVNRANREPV